MSERETAREVCEVLLTAGEYIVPGGFIDEPYRTDLHWVLRELRDRGYIVLDHTLHGTMDFGERGKHDWTEEVWKLNVPADRLLEMAA